MTLGTVLLLAGPAVQAQTPAPRPAIGGQTGALSVPPGPPGIVPPPDYVIGAEDVLSVRYWRDKDMSTDVTVRPDGRISLPLLNEVAAAGLTPAQLRDRLMEESKKYIEEPNISVVVMTINSRKVFLTGEVAKPGPYPLLTPTTVLQLIALAGGFKDYANTGNVRIVRNENGRMVNYKFDYKAVTSGKKSALVTNIELKPGDTIVVP
jgi:polysaccharide export outer membrane protein